MAEEKEEGRGGGMKQVSDPPGDLASDTPAKGRGGKETSEKSPAKQCWPDRGKKPKTKQTTNQWPRADLHLYWALGEYG